MYAIYPLRSHSPLLPNIAPSPRQPRQFYRRRKLAAVTGHVRTGGRSVRKKPASKPARILSQDQSLFAVLLPAAASQRQRSCTTFNGQIACFCGWINLAAFCRIAQNVLPHNNVPETDPYAKRARFALRMKLSLDARRRTHCTHYTHQVTELSEEPRPYLPQTSLTAESHTAACCAP